MEQLLHQDHLGVVDVMLQEAADEWMKENRRKASQQKIQTVYLGGLYYMPVKENSEEGDSSEIPDWSSISRLVCRNPTQSPSLKSGENRKVQKDQNLITEYTLAKPLLCLKGGLSVLSAISYYKWDVIVNSLFVLETLLLSKQSELELNRLTQNRVEKSEELSQLRAVVTIDKSCHD